MSGVVAAAVVSRSNPKRARVGGIAVAIRRRVSRRWVAVAVVGSRSIIAGVRIATVTVVRSVAEANSEAKAPSPAVAPTATTHITAAISAAAHVTGMTHVTGMACVTSMAYRTATVDGRSCDQ